MDLTNKRVLITGGTKGIGAAVALNFAKGGADVVINSRNQDDDANQVLDEIKSLGRKGVFIGADMADPAQIESLVAGAASALGGLDVLFHNAGGPAPGKLEDLTPEEWTRAFDLHVHAAYHLCRHGVPHLKKNKEGVVLFMSSAAGIRGCPGALVYGTVKGAMTQFTRMLARDLADDNIRVNCVAPGIIRTRFHEKMTPEAQQHNLANRIPLHREGTADDVAEVVNLLATNEFMTGETVVVDGGMTMQIVR